MYDRLVKAATHIRSLSSNRPKLGIVLGSGLGRFIEELKEGQSIPYSEIPYFKKTSVEGHEGRLLMGKIHGVEVAVLQGRTHAYEGHSLDDVVFPIRVLSLLGVKDLILTNAAGGINLSYQPGQLVCINDHLNFMSQNPLVGPNNADFGPRFPDMTEAYSKSMRLAMTKASQDLNIDLKEGVYVGVLGPTYETPAEIRMLRTLGADMVGMSTVPECIAANHLGMNVGGISLITNMGAGIQQQKLHHSDVKEEAQKAMTTFSSLLSLTIKKYYASQT